MVDIAATLSGVAFGWIGLNKPDMCPAGFWSTVSQDPNISSYSCSDEKKWLADPDRS
jgi:hypothetical protein